MDALTTAKAFGLRHLSIALMPKPATNEPDDVLVEMATDGVNQIIDALTRPVEISSHATREAATLPSEILTFRGDDLLDAFDGMNRHFLDQAWSDGFPLVPPTERTVEQMLSGTSFERDKVICLLEPGFGVATVEKIAINAVMAGCRPEHLPVVIAAVQCLAEPKMYLRNKATSTGPHAPLIIVNGPIAKELKINSKCCALGPGSISYANTVIGRALRLVMMNVGHTYPGISDMDTIGSPTKYSMCVAENEEDSPWEPFHVEQGFDKDMNTVTVQFVYGTTDLEDIFSVTADELAAEFATAPLSCVVFSTGLWLRGHREDPRYRTKEKEHHVFLIGPDHAHIFAKHGWTKNSVREYVYRNARMPAKLLAKRWDIVRTAHPELQWLEDCPDMLLPVVEDPSCYDIAVVGADVGRGAFFYGAGEPVTKVVEGRA